MSMFAYLTNLFNIKDTQTHTCTHDHVGGDIDGIPEGEDLKVLDKSEVALDIEVEAQVCQSSRHSEMQPNVKKKKVLKDCQ